LREYASSFWLQLYVLSKRTLVNVLRNPYLLRAQYLMSLCLGFLLGVIFFDLSYDLYGIQGRAGCNFFLVALLSFSSMSSLDTFFNERALFARERAQGMYRTSSYFVAKALCDVLPMRVVPPVIIGTITYWMMGHPQSHPAWEHYLSFLLVLILISLTATSFCFAISSATPSLSLGNLVAILSLLFFMLFGGLLANKKTIPSEVRWFKWASFMNYGYEILMVNELKDTTVTFNPPNIDPVTTTGTEFLDQFDMSADRLPLDVAVLFGMSCSYLLLSYAFLRWWIKERR